MHLTKQNVVSIAITVVEEMRSELVPYDTGNMARNALKYETVGNVFHITVDAAIAPYVPYTNEPWLSEKWHGKKNPNEGWWQTFAEEFAKRLAAKLKGEMK